MTQNYKYDSKMPPCLTSHAKPWFSADLNTVYSILCVNRQIAKTCFIIIGPNSDFTKSDINLNQLDEFL